MVNSRCLKLFQFFCEQDKALVIELLQNDPKWFVDGHQFFEIVHTILVRRCIVLNQQGKIVSKNSELIYSVCNLLF